MDALVPALAIGAFILALILCLVVRKHHKLLKGLPELKKELEKIAKELKAQEITDQISKLRNEVTDSARRSSAIKVIISRIFEAEEKFAKYAKELAQRERPEEIPEPLPPEAMSETTEVAGSEDKTKKEP